MVKYTDLYKQKYNVNIKIYIIFLIQCRCTSTSSGLVWVNEATQQKRVVKKVHRMGGNLAYGTRGQLFDMAIIEVNTPFTLNAAVVPAKLPTARTPVGTNVIVSGWGTTSEGNLK